MYCHIRECRHNLLFWWQICALLEFEVANSSTQCQVAIHSAEVYETACCAYSCFLALILRLVVEG